VVADADHSADHRDLDVLRAHHRDRQGRRDRRGRLLAEDHRSHRDEDRLRVSAHSRRYEVRRVARQQVASRGAQPDRVAAEWAVQLPTSDGREAEESDGHPASSEAQDAGPQQGPVQEPEPDEGSNRDRDSR